MKLCFWKACHDILPTRPNLSRREILVDPACLFCGAIETITHICRDCPFTTAVTDEGSLRDRGSCSNTNSLTLWLHSCVDSYSSSQFDRLMVFIWAVWKARNTLLWKDRLSSPFEVTFQASAWLNTFQRTHVRPLKSVRVRTRWTRPPLGWYSITMDGAFDEAHRIGGISVVARDHEGSFLMGCSLTVQHVYDSGQVEALARSLASQFAIEHGLGPVIFESGCLGLVQALSSSDTFEARLGPVYEDIGRLLQELPESSFSHIYWEANDQLHTG